MRKPTANGFMQIISIRTFIETGKFGSITLGSTKSDVINLLGKNLEFLDCKYVQIIRYGSYEFSYFTDSEVIFGITNDSLQELQINNKNIEIDTWFIDENDLPTFGDVIEQLEQNQIAFQIENTPSFNNEDYIRITNSNVTLDFKTSAEKQVADFKLLGIRLYEG